MPGRWGGVASGHDKDPHSAVPDNRTPRYDLADTMRMSKCNHPHIVQLHQASMRA